MNRRQRKEPKDGQRVIPGKNFILTTAHYTGDPNQAMGENLPKRPRKEEAVYEFQELVSKISSSILIVGVTQKQIDDWVSEPWSYKNIKHAHRWVSESMLPLVLEITGLLNSYDATYWIMVKMTQKHPHKLEFLRMCTRIKETWKRRPRYPNDVNRVKVVGY